MLTKNKTFDCVEMKRNAQEQLHVEYEARRTEFPSYFAFLETKATESPWQREFWARVAEARASSGR
jgi:hypothetical protein